MSSGGGGTTNTNTIQNTTPWSGAQPYLSYGLQQAQNIYGAGPYSGSYIAPQSAATQQSYATGIAAATNPNSLTSQAQNVLGNTLSGANLNPASNPYLASTVSDALGQAGTAFASQYGGAAGNNVNNSGYQEGLARDLGNTALPYYMQNYQQGVQNQLTATQEAPALDMAQAGQLGAVGSAQDQYAQAQIQAAQQAYNAPMNYLGQYANLVEGQGSQGGSSSAQQQIPYYTNPVSTYAGLGSLGLLGYMAYNAAPAAAAA